MEDNKDWKKEKFGRRIFIKGTLAATSLAALGGFIYPVFRYLFPTIGRATVKRVETFKMALSEIHTGEARLFKFKRKAAILIRKNEQELVAMSAVCTHLGCIVKFSEKEQMLICPCHGAKFDITGKVLAGPAPTPLQIYATKVDDGQVIVTEA